MKHYKLTHTHAWKLKNYDKLVPDVLGHVPRETSRFWFYFEDGGKLETIVLSSQYRTLFIPAARLIIMGKTKLTIPEDQDKYLKHLQGRILQNYNSPA